MKKYIMPVVLIIILISLSSCTNRKITYQKPNTNQAQKTLKNSKNKIIFIVQKSNQTKYGLDYIYYLFYLDPMGGKPRLILKTKNEITTNYLPGRKTMVISKPVSGNTRVGNIYFGNINGSDLKKIVRGRGFSFLPNKKQFVYTSDVNQDESTYYLFTADINGKNIKQLTYQPKNVERKIGPKYATGIGDLGPVVSSKGYIFFLSNWYRQNEFNTDIFRINIDGSNKTKLTDGKKEKIDYGNISISHNNKMLAILAKDASGKSTLLITDLNGKVIKKYPLSEKNPNIYPTFAWSTDNQEIAIKYLYKIDVLNINTLKVKTLFKLKREKDQTIQYINWLE